jgi:hypothetical protein
MAAPDIIYVPDRSGNGNVVTLNDPAAASIDKSILFALLNQSGDGAAITNELQDINAELDTHTTLLTEIEVNTTPIGP